MWITGAGAGLAEGHAPPLGSDLHVQPLLEEVLRREVRLDVGVVTRWFKDKRGISAETLAAFGVEITDSTETVKLPYPGATKFRKGLEKEGRKFWWDPPDMHGQALFTPPDAKQGSKMILVEGETDTMALWQGAPDAVKPTIRGLPGTESWKPHFADEFADADLVYVILDNDDPYDNAAAAESVERGWKKIHKALGKKARRVRLPQGTNDVAEFMQLYSWAALKVLLDKASELELPFKRMAFTDEPPVYDWMVDGLIVQGDIVLLAGDPGVGKSWFTLDLALCTLGLRDEWLGMKVRKNGPVLVVDQENPEMTVRNRVRKLGLVGDHPDLHYLWFQGVRLDADPERLYEYAELVEPKLIVIDSISRVHFKNENSAEEMNPLLNGGIYPLARQLGCTVVMIHHLAKHGGTRGSTALPAAVDLSLNVTTSEMGRQIVTPDKLRNVPPWGAALQTERVNEGERVIIRQWEEVAY